MFRNPFVSAAVAGAAAGLIATAPRLVPAIGLPPEPPGAPATEAGPLPAWWPLATTGSAACLALIAFAGVIPLPLPHLIGAPHLDTYWGVTPRELAAHFITLSPGAALAGWLSLRFFRGWSWERRPNSLKAPASFAGHG
ncbi:MAG: hypothetical protein OXF07_06580 [Rhodobacter sp.]|nr:hypothetical protein [Rhodobacter sp.]MCY4167824.1 hypothetical protein [Rhodobacter sp.]MCY4243627.1 hypothetical protein [Rhodobacter sp.]